ncbi:hypothetical protein RIF29_09264 [Crotalaria pallida]|uniref:Uncharacterized protein n=1 Tax=Crotalaria pallida TaxID=3830 RepID=A0AAN9FXW9_CROPI
MPSHHPPPLLNRALPGKFVRPVSGVGGPASGMMQSQISCPLQISPQPPSPDKEHEKGKANSLSHRAPPYPLSKTEFPRDSLKGVEGIVTIKEETHILGSKRDFKGLKEM